MSIGLRSSLPAFWKPIRQAWTALRILSGDDAYDRYLIHWRAELGHSESPPLSRKEFFRQELERKWHGIKRCC